RRRGERGPRRERGERGGRGGERAPRSADAQEKTAYAAGAGDTAPSDFADTAPLSDQDLDGNDRVKSAAAGTVGEDPQRRERRPRDRYGRDRRDRNPRDAGAENTVETTAQALLDLDLTQPEVAPAQEDAPRRSYFSAPSAEANSASAAEASAASAAPVAVAMPEAPAPAAPLVAPASVESAAPAPAPAPAPASAPAVATPAAAVIAEVRAPVAAQVQKAEPANVNAFVLPIDALHEVAAASGLQWVNSDAAKIAAVQAAIAAEPQPVRVPRERQAVATVDEGPLVLVETRRDLSAMKMSFEQSPGA
ncbi:MAG: ribonuclease E/G, partial [Burkholderiaceae bacterium]|nr:ribonuclease E/G [Burkholderiaceae bacterium]